MGIKEEEQTVLLLKEKLLYRLAVQEVINYLFPGVLVTLNVDNSKGTVLVRNSSNNLSACLYIDEDDKTGVMLDPSKPMELKKGEELVLSKKAKRTLREISLLLPPDEDGDHVPIPRVLVPDTV